MYTSTVQSKTALTDRLASLHDDLAELVRQLPADNPPYMSSQVKTHVEAAWRCVGYALDGVEQ